MFVTYPAADAVRDPELQRLVDGFNIYPVWNGAGGGDSPSRERGRQLARGAAAVVRSLGAAIEDAQASTGPKTAARGRRA